MKMAARSGGRYPSLLSIHSGFWRHLRGRRWDDFSFVVYGDDIPLVEQWRGVI